MRDFNDSDVIDFEPANIEAVVSMEKYIAVELPRQPCYSQITGDDPSTAPEYSCEMRVIGGTVEQLNVDFPFVTEYWEVEYLNGTRACFLPHDFMADGPVKLTFYKDEFNNPAIVIKGEKFNLRVLGESDSESRTT